MKVRMQGTCLEIKRWLSCWGLYGEVEDYKALHWALQQNDRMAHDNGYHALLHIGGGGKIHIQHVGPGRAVIKTRQGAIVEFRPAGVKLTVRINIGEET